MEIHLKNHKFFSGFLKTIEQLKVEQPCYGEFKATINPQCEIFRGHFPSNPIVPGALLIWTAKLLIEKILGIKELKISSITGAKFRKPIKESDSIIFKINITSQQQLELSARCKVEKNQKEAGRFNMTLTKQHSSQK